MAAELLPTIEKPSAVGALMLHLQHIVQGQTIGTDPPQYHCVVSLSSLVRARTLALAVTPVSSKLLRLNITLKPPISIN